MILFTVPIILVLIFLNDMENDMENDMPALPSLWGYQSEYLARTASLLFFQLWLCGLWHTGSYNFLFFLLLSSKLLIWWAAKKERTFSQYQNVSRLKGEPGKIPQVIWRASTPYLMMFQRRLLWNFPQYCPTPVPRVIYTLHVPSHCTYLGWTHPFKYALISFIVPHLSRGTSIYTLYMPSRSLYLPGVDTSI